MANSIKLKSNSKAKKIKSQKKVAKPIFKSKPIKQDKKNNSETNSNLLRIPKNNEQKPEIKKVKKTRYRKKRV